MARKKGSRNKVPGLTAEERIAAIDAEIENLQEQIKEKKAERRKLTAEKKAEDQKKLIDAVEKSGKSIEEIIAFVSNKE